MAIHFQYDKYYIMKLIFTIALFFTLVYGFAQNIELEVIGNMKCFKKTFQNGFVIYQPLCENNDYLFSSDGVIIYGILSNIRYLKSYDYKNNFECKQLLDSSFITQIKDLFASDQALLKEVCILHGMQDRNGEIVAFCSLFTQKQFQKFVKKASKTKHIKRRGSQEAQMEVVYDYKYSQTIIIAKHNGQFKLFQTNSKGVKKCWRF